MIHLDTHVVVWLAGGASARLSSSARDLVETEQLEISPAVELEMAFLAEIGRLTAGPATALSELHRALGLTVASSTFGAAASLAATSRYAFTRDPFDRLIAAHADAVGAQLITKDRVLRQNLDFAVWN